ncbi:MAG: hypothetical protein GY792_18355 [Gammaproteobacteria bacterium]|nr:hypothetical protein [Gammaproteobacteria bacterium]
MRRTGGIQGRRDRPVELDTAVGCRDVPAGAPDMPDAPGAQFGLSRDVMVSSFFFTGIISAKMEVLTHTHLRRRRP